MKRLLCEAPTESASFFHDLAVMFPPGGSLSWLRPVWRPDWERWCLYQMVPPEAAPTTLWGPDTEVIARMETVLGTRRVRMATNPRYKLLLNRALMTQWAWRVHLETGCYPEPFWVVQGHRGGHKWSFTEHESKLLEMAGQSGEPPEPGALPYAPLDRRVLEQVAMADQLKTLTVLSKGYHELDHRELDQREVAQMQEANRVLYQWLANQVDAVIDETLPESHSRKIVQDADSNYEAAEEAFVTSTD